MEMRNDSQQENPPENDFSKCIYCQRITKDKIVNTRHKLFKKSSYQTFLDNANKKSELGNPDFTNITLRLQGYTADKLEASNATWHRDCYLHVIRNITRDEDRHQRAIISQDTSVVTYRKRGRPSLIESETTHCEEEEPPLTRSKTTPFDKTQCIFCSPIPPLDTSSNAKSSLYRCCTSNQGKRIQETIEKSNNKVWKVRLANVLKQGDLLASDILYHPACLTTQWEKYIQRPCRKENYTSEIIDKSNDINADKNKDFNRIAAKIHFFNRIQDELKTGSFLDVSKACQIQREIFCKFGIYETNKLIWDRVKMKKKLLKNLQNIGIKSRGNQGSQVFSLENTDIVPKSCKKDDIKNLFNAAKYLRKIVHCTLKNNKWKFEGLLDNHTNSLIPTELKFFMQWLTQGTKVEYSEKMNDNLKCSLNNSCHSVIQNFKTDRQTCYQLSCPESHTRSRVETPPAIAMSLHNYYLHRSKKDITFLHKASVGVSYDRVKSITNEIATEEAHSIMENNGVYIPPGLRYGVPIQASSDNIDMKVDTHDGKNTFHGTATTVYQKLDEGRRYEYIRSPLKLKIGEKTKFPGNIPSSVVPLKPCDIKGSPKPSTSPQYPDYEVGRNYSEILLARTWDFIWLFLRYMSRSKQVSSSILLKNTDNDIGIVIEGEEKDCSNSSIPYQHIPTWRAFNSLLENKNKIKTLDECNSLPIINAHAPNWETIVTVLMNLYHLNNLVSPDDTLIISFDMDLYKRAIKLDYLDENFKNKWFLVPGPFHTSLCAIRCLGKTIENSGIDEAWIKSGLYSKVVVMQLINGSHYDRAVEAHEMTLQVFYKYYLDAFFKSRSALWDGLVDIRIKLGEAFQQSRSADTSEITSLFQELSKYVEQNNIEKQLKEFDEYNSIYPMFKWYRMYMDQVLLLLAFHRSIKSSNLFLYLASIEKLATYFFAYNRLDYAQNMLEFTARTYKTHSDDPKLWDRLVNGAFTVTKNKVPFTSIGLDQAQEHENKNLKVEGGLKGITTKPSVLLKYCLTAPLLKKIAIEVEKMFNIEHKDEKKHHHLNNSVKLRQEIAVNAMIDTIGEENIFDDKSNHLFNLIDKRIVSEDAKRDILSVVERGDSKKNIFVENRIRGEENLWAKMTKVKYRNWDDSCKDIKLKGKSQEFNLKASTSLLTRLFVIAKTDQNIDLKEAISNYEFSNVNTKLMNHDGTLLKMTSKSDLIVSLKSLVTAESLIEGSSTCFKDKFLIIDGMAVVQAVMHSRKFSNCSEMSIAVVKSIDNSLSEYEGGRIIFDNYNKKLALKDMFRYGISNKKSSDIKVCNDTPIRDVNEFLSNSATKDKLTIYLSEKLIECCKSFIVVATRKNVLSNRNDFIPTTGVSSHEEADTLMMLHALEIVNSKLCRKVDFFTQDTDWWVLILRHLPELGRTTNIIRGTSQKREKILMWPIFEVLGKTRAEGLPGFHALTGCDFSGKIKGIGKTSSFKTFMKAPAHIIKGLTELGNENEIPDNVFSACEEFVCTLLSSKQISAIDAPTLRWKTFKILSGTKGVDDLPPTRGAWTQFIRRAYIPARLFNQNTVLHPLVPDPMKFGWCLVNGQYMPLLSENQVAPKNVVELVRCKCGVTKCKSKKHCVCKRNGVNCTELCSCEDNEECCNKPVLRDESTEE